MFNIGIWSILIFMLYNFCPKGWHLEAQMKYYKCCSEINASSFITLLQDVRGGCWCYVVEARPPCQYHMQFCCCVTDGSRGAVWWNSVIHGNASLAKMWNLILPMQKTLLPLTFTVACWMFMETKQWMWTW